jgi:hypothetical protein
VEDVNESGRRQKFVGASYDTFSVQYQKNNFYLAGARKHMCTAGCARNLPRVALLQKNTHVEQYVHSHVETFAEKLLDNQVSSKRLF